MFHVQGAQRLEKQGRLVELVAEKVDEQCCCSRYCVTRCSVAATGWNDGLLTCSIKPVENEAVIVSWFASVLGWKLLIS